MRRGRRRGRRRNSSSRECSNLTCFNIAYCFDAGTTTCVQNKQPVYLLVCLCSCVLVCLSQWCHLKEQIKHLSQFGSCMLPCEIACAQETRETKNKQQRQFSLRTDNEASRTWRPSAEVGCCVEQEKGRKRERKLRWLFDVSLWC